MGDNLGVEYISKMFCLNLFLPFPIYNSGASPRDVGGKDVASPNNIERIAHKIQDTTGHDDEYIWYE